MDEENLNYHLQSLSKPIEKTPYCQLNEAMGYKLPWEIKNNTITRFYNWIESGQYMYLRQVCEVFDKYKIKYPNCVNEELIGVGKKYLFRETPTTYTDVKANKAKILNMAFQEMANYIYSGATLKTASEITATAYNAVLASAGSENKEKTAGQLEREYTDKFRNTGVEKVFFKEWNAMPDKNEHIEVWRKIIKTHEGKTPAKLRDGRPSKGNRHG